MKPVHKVIPTSLETVNKFESLPKNIRQDEFDTFGQHVANLLRTMPISNGIICQNFIMNHISQERLKILNKNQTENSATYDASTPRPST